MTYVTQITQLKSHIRCVTFISLVLMCHIHVTCVPQTTQITYITRLYIDQRTVCCSATHCNTLQHTATHCNTLQHTQTTQITYVTRLYIDQRTVCCSATHCNTLQHTATHCNTLQHTATHSNNSNHIYHASIHRPP